MILEDITVIELQQAQKNKYHILGFIYLFTYLLAILQFKFRASYFLGRLSITWVTHTDQNTTFPILSGY
jgi:hypothetical protein